MITVDFGPGASKVQVGGMVAETIRLLAAHAHEINQWETGHIEVDWGKGQLKLKKAQTISVCRERRSP